MTLAFYNERDPKAAAWLRELIAGGHVAPGVVDERDIRDIRPAELAAFRQCHFFAGIGVWSHALRAAGWPDDRPVWTGSCPCQPFSAAGKRAGTDDERRLWPHWHWLIDQCRPAIVLGEQVASKDGLAWLDLVSADLEGSGYAIGAADLCAAGVEMDYLESQCGEWLERAIHDCTDPRIASALRDFAGWTRGAVGVGGAHIRQRLYFVGLADDPRERHEWSGTARDGRTRLAFSGNAGGVADTASGRREPRAGHGGIRRPDTSAGIAALERSADSATGRLADSDGWNTRTERQQRSGEHGQQPPDGGAGFGMADSERTARPRFGNVSGQGVSEQDAARLAGSSMVGRVGRQRADAGMLRGHSVAGERPDPRHERRDGPDWLLCRDDKWRPVGPGTFPLADAAPARVGRLRGYGNALDAGTARQWCEVVIAQVDHSASLGREAA